MKILIGLLTTAVLAACALAVAAYSLWALPKHGDLARVERELQADFEGTFWDLRKEIELTGETGPVARRGLEDLKEHRVSQENRASQENAGRVATQARPGRKGPQACRAPLARAGPRGEQGPPGRGERGPQGLEGPVGPTHAYAVAYSEGMEHRPAVPDYIVPLPERFRVEGIEDTYVFVWTVPERGDAHYSGSLLSDGKRGNSILLMPIMSVEQADTVRPPSGPLSTSSNLRAAPGQPVTIAMTVAENNWPLP